MSESPKKPRRSERLQNKRKKSNDKKNVPPNPPNPPNPPRREPKRPRLDEIFVFIVPQKEKEVEDEEEVEEEEEEEEEEVEEGEIFGPFFPEKKNIKTIKFDKIFENLDELIQLGEKYDPSYIYICNVDIRKLHNIVPSLKELNDMIGLKKFKKNIIDQLVYILTRDFTNTSEIPMLHSCIYGSPGTGKTSVCEILGKIYASCGLLSKGDIKIAKREDFVGEYLGSTTIKTKKLLESCKGKVLFIDEVYSFGSSRSNNKDSFAKEAVDSLNLFLSENYRDFICIIAGYEEDVDKCFFAVNQGLKRRFTNKYTIEGYSGEEMAEIFLKFIKDSSWSVEIEKEKLIEFFIEHKNSFPYYGGDIKTLVDKCKIIHSRKVVMLDKNLWQKLNEKDIKEGFISYLEERQVKKEDKNPSHLHMYL